MGHYADKCPNIVNDEQELNYLDNSKYDNTNKLPKRNRVQNGKFKGKKSKITQRLNEQIEGSVAHMRTKRVKGD